MMSRSYELSHSHMVFRIMRISRRSFPGGFTEYAVVGSKQWSNWVL